MLTVLAAHDPTWTLTGGAALSGFYLHHRTTRDLDLFFHNRKELGTSGEDCARILTAAGMRVSPLHRSDMFLRLQVSDEEESTVVDFVAEPVATIHPPETLPLESAEIPIDARSEILVNKLCALLSRSELRDLIDVKALLAGREDLRQALIDAPRKDAGFSAATLAWVLRSLPVATMAKSLGLDSSETRDLETYRGELLAQLLTESHPEAEG